MTDRDRAHAPPAVSADLRRAVAKSIDDISRVGRRYHHADDMGLQNADECADVAFSTISAAGYVIRPREPTDDVVHEAMRIACCARPAGGSDGCGTVVLTVPTFSSMKAAIRAAIAAAEPR